MPVLNGLQATQKIRQSESAYQNIPIIALTGHSTEEGRKMCLESGMNHTLFKPIKISVLESTHAQILSHENDNSIIH